MDTTPLLTAVGGRRGPNALMDHPAFLRASHSPWRFIPQDILVYLRGFVLAYLVAASIMTANYKLNEDSDFSNWRHVFDFAVVGLIMAIVYHAITFGWTFTHLYYPQPDEVDGRLERLAIHAISLPRNLLSLRKQFYFTLFYTVSVVFAFMNSTIYWFITRQQNAPGVDPVPPQESGTAMDFEEVGMIWGWDTDTSMMPLPQTPLSDLFGKGWFRAFVILNLYGITSLIMIFEILFLNSIRRPYAIGAHVFGLIFFSGMYLGWAAIGQLLTGWYAFFWMNVDEVGSQEAVTLYSVGFVVLAPFMYIFMQGFVAVRESLTRTLSEARAIAAAQEALDS